MSSPRRIAKIAQAVREVVGTAILFDLKDPRVEGADVTVTGVEVAPDARSAKIHVSVMGDEKHQALCMHGLRSARGFLQSRIADRVQTRYTPILSFVLDAGVKQSIAASRILQEVVPENADADETGELDDSATDD